LLWLDKQLGVQHCSTLNQSLTKIYR